MTPLGMVPELDDVTVVGLVVIVVPSYLTVIVELATKLVPDNVILAPTLPLDGESEIVG